jgi:hypothetical protein
MRIPTRHLDLKEIGYEGYWIEAPRSVPRSFLDEMAPFQVANRQGRILTPEETEKSRKGELLVLDRFTGWNIDDDESRVLPLTRSIKPDQFDDDPADQADGKTAEQKCFGARLRILSFVPVEIIAYVSRKITMGDALNQETAGF